MTIEGDADVAGSDDEAAIVYTSAMAGRAARRDPVASQSVGERALDDRRRRACRRTIACSRCFRSRTCSGSRSTGSAPLLAGAQRVHDGAVQPRARRRAHRAEGDHTTRRRPGGLSRAARPRSNASRATIGRAARVHLRRSAARRRVAAGPLVRRDRRRAAPGIWTDRGRTGLSLQSRRPSERARNARRAASRRGRRAARADRLRRRRASPHES